MSIEHKLVITLSAEDLTHIIKDHLNKGLSKDFEVNVDGINFDMLEGDYQTNSTFTGVTVNADFIDPKSRSIR